MTTLSVEIRNAGEKSFLKVGNKIMWPEWATEGVDMNG